MKVIAENCESGKGEKEMLKLYNNSMTSFFKMYALT